MNKSKIVLAAVGGVFAVLILVAGGFVFSAVSERDAARDGDPETGSDGLELLLDKATQLSKKEVFPCPESEKAIQANSQRYADWKEEAHDLAARGDKVFARTTPPAFKEFLIGEAKRLTALPGGVAGRIAKPDFAYGPFADFITGAKMPPEKDLARLQRQWDDVATVIEMFAQAGVAEIVEIAVEEVAAKPAEEAPRKSAKKAKKAKASATAAAEAKEPAGIDRQKYRFVFNTRPSGLVRTLNALAVCERFIVVDSYSFRHAKDVIGETHAGEKKPDEAASSGRGRRRNRRAAEEAAEKSAAESRGNVITDPQTDEPVNVTLTLSVYDFGSLQEEKK